MVPHFCHHSREYVALCTVVAANGSSSASAGACLLQLVFLCMLSVSRWDHAADAACLQMRRDNGTDVILPCTASCTRDYFKTIPLLLASFHIRSCITAAASSVDTSHMHWHDVFDDSEDIPDALSDDNDVLSDSDDFVSSQDGRSTSLLTGMFLRLCPLQTALCMLTLPFIP